MKLFIFLQTLTALVVLVHSKNALQTDHLRYVNEWPPTFCLTAKCKVPIPDQKFTLHGVWPIDANGVVMTHQNSNCDTTEPDWNKVFADIESRLAGFWSPLRENGRNWDLWKHEWREHGSCGGTTAREYFKTAININGMFTLGNLFKYLATSEIIACDSMSFTTNEVVTAVRKVVGSNIIVFLTCVPHNTTHEYLREVVTCTNVQGTSFISCNPKGAPTKYACSTDRIMLPHPPKTKSLEKVHEETYETSYVSAI